MYGTAAMGWLGLVWLGSHVWVCLCGLEFVWADLGMAVTVNIYKMKGEQIVSICQ